MAQSKLEKQAQEIIKLAEESGTRFNYFFITTFNRYLEQLSILEGLENAMKEDGVLVTKEYVKGRKNLYSNPAVLAYNRTVDSANKTVTTLMQILKNFGVSDNGGTKEDPLMKIINGGD